MEDSGFVPLAEDARFFTPEQAAARINEIKARWPRAEGMTGTTAQANADIGWLLRWIAAEDDRWQDRHADYHIDDEGCCQ